MLTPSQGFRHAATLLITSRLRAIAHDAAPPAVADALARLADELVALARDTHTTPEATGWLIETYQQAIDRLPHAFNIEAAKAHGSRTLARTGLDARDVERRDLFLIYVPEDRLPVAAPLAIELTKRRVSVAFSEYEVATQEQLASALEHGLMHHGAGVLLCTNAFERAGLHPPTSPGTRLRVLGKPDEFSTVDALVNWSRTLSRDGAV